MARDAGALGEGEIWRRRALAGVGLTLGATFGLGSTAHAETYIVDSLQDDGTGGTTLREAIEASELNSGFDRVVFASGLSGDINLVDDQLEVTQPIEIVGPGAGRLTVHAAEDQRIFQFDFEPEGKYAAELSGLTLTGGDAENGGAIQARYVDLSISDMVLTNNQADEYGGAIAADIGRTTISSSKLTNNYAEDGGALATDAFDTQVTVVDSTISGNQSVDHGGGISVKYAKQLLVLNSTISGNDAGLDGGDGGGIEAEDSPVTLLNSTVHGNTADDGGGINFDGTHEGPGPPGKLTVRNSTVTGNSASDAGGGIDNDIYDETEPYGSAGPGMLLLNSIVADNTAPTATGTDPQQGIDIDGNVDAAFSLIEDPRGAAISHITPGSNLIGTDPALGPLADNGGQTRTRAPSLTSPVVDAGDSRGAPADQRGFDRPIDRPTVANATAPGADAADMGAVELQLGAGDVVWCRNVRATIVASGPGQTTFGTPGRDVIAGTPGNDTIRGLGGNDLICGYRGFDNLRGGPGNDVILGGKSPDAIFGGRGFDLLLGGPREDRIFGGLGRDRIFGESGRDRLFGNQGPDKMLGGPRNDRMFGGLGNDWMRGGFGDDEMFGWRGRDMLLGGMGDDLMVGGPGIDTIFGLLNGSDHDRIFGGGDGDKIVGGPGPDQVTP